MFFPRDTGVTSKSRESHCSPLPAAHPKAAVATNTQQCNVSPHSARHGGPSEDHFKSVRPLPSIQERARWSAAESVDRYRKAGALLRMIAELSPAVQASGERAATSLSTKLTAAVSSMSAVSFPSRPARSP